MPWLGWQRNMWYGLCQQIVRQDPAYYATYVCLRPGHAWERVSFPYYTKNTQPGEKTAFKHIDINVNDLLATGRGEDIIQGSLFLDDEDEKMYDHLAGNAPSPRSSTTI